MSLRKKPLLISQLINQLEELKKTEGDLEIWMTSSQVDSVGNDVFLDSVSTVSLFKVAQNDYTGVMLIHGQDYLKL